MTMNPALLFLTSYFFFAQEIPMPDTARLSAWLVDAAALAAILLVFLKVIDHFKRRPSLEQELEKLLRQIRSELNQIRVEHAEHLAEVRSRVEGAHQRVDHLTHDLNNKLQRLPGEIVDILHKTGVLKGKS
jgi:enoyl-[acyl-carrier-protein] reductase (NADH)